MKTQKQEVLERIQRDGGITRAQAANMYIFELSSRIGELEADGWSFTKTPIHGKRPGGRAWRVIRYSDPVRL